MSQIQLVSPTEAPPENLTLFGPEIPEEGPELSGWITPTRVNFAAWKKAQLRKVVYRLGYSQWEATCPVCGDLLRRAASRAALVHGMRRHFDGHPPVGLELLAYNPGDQIILRGQLYHVESGPQRPTVGRYGRPYAHVFYLVVKRADGTLWQTSWRKPGELNRWKERK